jgi:hypothetical protein
MLLLRQKYMFASFLFTLKYKSAKKYSDMQEKDTKKEDSFCPLFPKIIFKKIILLL